MALEIGSRLGHYDVTALIGEGGMGQVYQATDTKLKRQVALKILPEAFSADPERLARFQREAEVLASLNHPNIAAIFGLEEADDTRALVLELVEGPTLADRIKRGPIPLDEALPIAKQIAEALEAAHEAGVIHRDLKPANIKVREDGTVKVLDFGLAKALDPIPEGDPSQSPTMTAAATRLGTVMGTATYMSPEQATGRPAEKRSDLWSFGVILLEMLTGRSPFAGDTVSETLAKVLKTEPDWTLLPDQTPEPIRRLLQRCLSKDRKTRIGDAAVARMDIDEATESTRRRPDVVRVRGGSSPAPWLWAAGGAVAAVLGFVGWSASAPDVATPQPTRVEISLPVSQQLVLTGFNHPIALSSDGRQLAYVGRSEGGSHLYLKRQDEFTATPVAGTEGATFPFFSPDDQWLGFFAGGELRRVPISGGTPLVICTVRGMPFGATWGPDDDVVFAVLESGLSQVSVAGGEPTQLTHLATSGAYGSHVLPWYLPDGSGVRGGPRNSDRLLRWDPDQGEGVWHATEETELSC